MRPSAWLALAVGVLTAAVFTPSGPSVTSRVAPPRPSQNDRLVVTFDAGGRPEAQARFADATYRPIVGSYCWEKPTEDRDFVMRCVDKVRPTAHDLGPLLRVPRGTELVAGGDAKRVGCYVGPLHDPRGNLTAIEMTEGHAALDLAPGEYLMECEVSWPRGRRAPFSLGMEILTVAT